jgi:uncharacterized protein
MSSSFVPVKVSERVILMDALRGLALLGIFIANIPGFNFFSQGTEPVYTSAFDHKFEFLGTMLIEGKFYSIFSLLFGWGIAVQLQRREEKSLNPISFARRRLLFMLLLGLAHIVFLWIGDIVAFYAMVGFVLLVMRKWKDRTLLILAILLIFSPILWYYLKMQINWTRVPSGFLFETGDKVTERITGINSNDSFFKFANNMDYFDLIKLNIGGFFYRYGDLVFQSRPVKVLGIFIIGYLLGRNGRYKTLLKDQRFLWIVAISGLVTGLIFNYLMAQVQHKDPSAYYSFKPAGFIKTIYYALGVAPLAMGYVAIFCLFATTAMGRGLVKVLHYPGKMAFTNYIMQSFIATIFFMPFGFQMMGKLGPAYQFLFAFVVFVFQIILSRIWLSYFQFGPVEWLWRSATYGKWQSMKIQEA